MKVGRLKLKTETEQFGQGKSAKIIRRASMRPLESKSSEGELHGKTTVSLVVLRLLLRAE